jgi:hypothetical protein
MVTLNCSSFYVTIFKSDLKNVFEDYQFRVKNTAGLWFQVDTLEKKHMIARKKDPNNNYYFGSDNDLDESSLSEFSLSMIENFIQKKEDSLTTLIKVNLSLANEAQSQNDDAESASKRKQFFYENLFLNIELNLYYSKEFISILFKNNRQDVLETTDKQENFDFLMPECREFFIIQNSKKDLLIKRDCVFNLKLRLMEYRTSIATHLNTKTVEEMKLNEIDLLRYLNKLNRQIGNLSAIESDLDFEMELLKLINKEWEDTLEYAFEDKLTKAEDDFLRIDRKYVNQSKDISVDLNQQDFFNKIKNYQFKIKYDRFFRSFFVKKENQFLTLLNKQLIDRMVENQTNET